MNETGIANGEVPKARGCLAIHAFVIVSSFDIRHLLQRLRILSDIQPSGVLHNPLSFRASREISYC
jgi:hypothetical protein